MTHRDAHEHHLAVRREALACLDAMSREEHDHLLKMVYFNRWGGVKPKLASPKAKGAAK